jgi:hypothetical protein
MKARYLRWLYSTIAIAILLSWWPNDNGFVRFLCMILWGIMAAWTDRLGQRITA